MLSKVEHDYNTLKHTCEFQQKEYSLEKATLKAKAELATKRLNEANQNKTNALQLSNELEMAKAELILLKNENITLNQTLIGKESEINKLNSDILSNNYNADMNKAEIVIIRQELKAFDERYALKENQAIELSSDLLKVKEELKRAIDEKEEITRKLTDQETIFNNETANLKTRMLTLENSKTKLEQQTLVSRINMYIYIYPYVPKHIYIRIYTNIDIIVYRH